MHESDLDAEDARARLGVDQLGTLTGKLCDRGVDVVDRVGDVMHTGPVAGEKLADRRVRVERRNQLDTPVAHQHRGRFEAPLLRPDAVLEPAAEEALVGLHRLVEIRNSDADVVDSACLHTSDAM